MSIEDAKEAIYTSLENGNEDIDLHIAALKDVAGVDAAKGVEFDPERLSQNNRAGRKMMQAYFKKRGVKVVFSA